MVYEIISKPNIPSQIIRARVPLFCKGHSLAEERRELLLLLSAALRRSQVVVLLWDLSDRELDISRILSKSLGLPAIPAGDDAGGFCLPDGAVAFIDTNAAVYGFYLESGPQSIIVLTHLEEAQDFAVRAFLVPYLMEKYPQNFGSPAASSGERAIPPRQPQATSPSALQETAEGIPPKPPEAAPSYDTQAAPSGLAKAEAPLHEAPEAGALPGPAEAEAPSPAPPAAPAVSPSLTAFASDDLPGMELFSWEQDAQQSEDPAAPRKKSGNGKSRVPLPLKILTIVLAVLLAALGGFLAYDKYFAGRLADDHYKKLKALKGQSGSGALPSGVLSDFGALYQENNRIAGWITLKGTGIDYPVLVPPENDANYYIRRLTDGTYNKYGAPFFPKGYEPVNYYQNTVITGANYGDGRMFSDFEKYFDQAFFSEHPAISYDSLYAENEWLVLAVLITDPRGKSGGDFDPAKSYFYDDAEFLDFIEKIKKRALIYSDVEVGENDVLLTILTDYSRTGDAGMAVVARKLRSGEEIMEAEARVNPSPALPETWRLRDGSSTLPVRLQLALEQSQKGFNPVVGLQLNGAGQGSSYSGESVSSAPETDASAGQASAASEPASGQSSAAAEKGSSSLASKNSVSKAVSSKNAPAASSKAAASSGGISSAPPASSGTASPPANPGTSATLTVKNQLDGNKQVSGPAQDIIAQVVEAEMGSGFHINALKAQAIAAYTWILNQGGVPAVPMKPALARAKEATAAVLENVVLYGGKRANVFYFATSAGKTARSEDVWSTPYPYLISVDSSVDKNAANFQTLRVYKKDDMANWIKTQYAIDVKSLPPAQWFQVTYDANEIYAKTVKIGGSVSVAGLKIRSDLLTAARVGSANVLRSHAFRIDYDEKNAQFRFTVLGYGHGCGMSQTGANFYAGSGWGYQEILLHYFPGCKVGKNP